ncbi:carboxypeptidase-like regulatory domain-containing protein [Rubricoccus marinus]|uniref:Carboxypeptidase-like regulatory domain-containing protein n=1 Tax=Rubricoccus marinus TaxID=716817 RepID=A0A259U1S0_9BACT|nr:carboxypeptidase-like regulatory domain-containing protein [Rubricoccus marinus]OZC03788.1 hypothetical protein BSZ36_12815 [Rubricoccus marinus]
MRALVIVLLLLASGALAQPATVNGIVRDASGFPLPGANVYLSGTARGAASDADGKYSIEDVPPGAYRIVASMLGYQAAVREIRLAGGARIYVTLELEPSAVEMGTARVEAERDRRWERRLAQFARVLLGESANADSTRILNPEVLSFRSSWGTLTATAAAPLLIENRALGYRLRYDLHEFEASSGRVRYHGDEVFEPLAPGDSAEARRWAAARKRAYLGSQAHLFRALLEGTAEDEGFTLLHVFDGDGLDRRAEGATFRTSSDDLLQEASYGWGTLRFRGRVDVAYGGEPEDEAYLTSEWFRERRRVPDPVQRSTLHLNESSVRLDPQGTPEDPFAISTSGYMAYERLADRVPEEYRPEE